MARLYPKRGVWYAWGYDAKGKRWIRTTRQRERRAAVIVARRIEREIVGADDASAHPSETLGEAVVRLLAFLATSGKAPLTIANNRAKSGHLVRVLGADLDIAGLAPPDGTQRLSAYVGQRVSEGAQRSTISAEVDVLKSMLRCSARAGLWRWDTRLLRVMELDGAKKPRKRWALPGVLASFVAAIPPQWRDYVEAWAGTGMRKAELYRMTPARLDFAGGRIHVPGTKTEGADRWIHMTPRVRQIMRRRAKLSPMFKPWSAVTRDTKLACERAQVPYFSPSDLRRTFASIAISSGVSASVLKELLGHRTTKQIDRVYGHASDEAKRDAVRRVAKGVARTASPRGTRGTRGTGKTRKKR